MSTVGETSAKSRARPHPATLVAICLLTIAALALRLYRLE